MPFSFQFSVYSKILQKFNYLFERIEETAAFTFAYPLTKQFFGADKFICASVAAHMRTMRINGMHTHKEANSQG